MKKALKDLSPLEKLVMAVECMEQSVPFPTVIQDFLMEYGLLDLITRNRKPNGKLTETSVTKGKSRIRSRSAITV